MTTLPAFSRSREQWADPAAVVALDVGDRAFRQRGAAGLAAAAIASDDESNMSIAVGKENPSKIVDCASAAVSPAPEG